MSGNTGVCSVRGDQLSIDAIVTFVAVVVPVLDTYIDKLPPVRDVSPNTTFGGGAKFAVTVVAPFMVTVAANQRIY
jgi:hypothetical protein